MKRYAQEKILIITAILILLLSSCTSIKKEEPPKIDVVIEEPIPVEQPVEKLEIEEPVIDTPTDVTPEEKVKEEVEEKTKEEIVKKSPIEKFSQLEMMKYGNISFYVVDLEDGKVVDSYRENSGLVPASVMKVVTSGASIEVMGEEKTFKTKLLYTGNINGEGVLQGDLFIVGGGDPTLGSKEIKREPTAFITNWLNKMKKLGIKSVTGDLVVLDGKFGYNGISDKWLWEDMGTEYAQGVYGISIFDNLYTLTLKSGEVGSKPKILSVKPKVKGMTFDNQAKVSPDGRRKLSIRGIPFDNKRRIVGVVPKNSTISLRSDIPNPGLFLGEYFASEMKKVGITLKGKVVTERSSSKKTIDSKVIGIVDSVPLSEIVRILLEKSNNHYTEHLFQLLKSDYNTNIEKFWKSKGIDVSSLIMRDGSGLSRGNVLSAKILVDILMYMDKNTNSQFQYLLPVAGEKGTVADFMRESGITARIKSGSMSGIQAYAGYLEKGEKRYAFAIIVNHWNGTRRQLKKEMEKLLIQEME